MNETLLEKYSAIEQTIAQEKGPFKLFALFEIADTPRRWDVVLSAAWLPGDKVESLRFIFDHIRAVLDDEEFLYISKVILLEVNEPFVKELQTFLEAHHNQSAFSNTEINGVEIKKGYIITSPVSSSEKVSPKSSDILTAASQWIRKAAAQGDSDAQNTLGLMYLKGEGVKQNLNQAKKWFRKAATLGHAQAQQHLEALLR
jgi:hypothetical protein